MPEGGFGAAEELHLLRLIGRWVSFTMIHLAQSMYVSTTDGCITEG